MRKSLKAFNFLYKDINSKTINPEILQIANKIDSCYSKARISKPNGKFRHLLIPNVDLIDIQKKILLTIKELNLKNSLVSKNAFGLGGKDRSIQKNASFHKNHRYILCIDLKDFFPNVNSKKVKECFRTMGCNNKEVKLLTKLTTLNSSLPQGIPTSPILACICLHGFDKRFYNYCVINNLLYTRYFDDITISSKEKIDKDFREDIKSMIENILQQEGLNTLKINEEKTKIFDLQKEHCEITGVVVENQKLKTKYHPGFPKYEYILKNIPINSQKINQRLNGVLSFINSVDPEYSEKIEKAKNSCMFRISNYLNF